MSFVETASVAEHNGMPSMTKSANQVPHVRSARPIFLHFSRHMRRRCWKRTFFIAAFIYLILPPVFCLAENLVKGGDFEADYVQHSQSFSLPAGWDVNNSSKTMTLLKQDPQARPGSSGRFSQRVEGSGPRPYFGFVQQVKGLEVGREYVLQFWIRVLDGGSAAIEFSPAGKPEVLQELYEKGPWRRVTFGFIAEADSYRLSLRSAKVTEGGTLKFLVDDVELLNWEEVKEKFPTNIERIPRDHYDFKYAYDFGSNMTPLMEGYKPVNHMALYSKEKGWGFASIEGIQAGGNFERIHWKKNQYGPKNALSGDWLHATSAGEAHNEFRVDMPPGEYKVHLLIGRPDGIKQPLPFFSIYAEGKKRLSIIMRRKSNLIDNLSFHVSVKEGQLNLLFTSDGMVNPELGKKGWLINALVIYPARDRGAAEKQLEMDELSIYRLPAEELSTWSQLKATPPKNPHRPTKEETERGFVLFAPGCTGPTPYEGPILPDTQPSAEQVSSRLSVRLTPGEYEPLLIGVYPLKNVDGVSARIQGTAFNENNIEIRRVRYVAHGTKKKGYRLKPLLLEKFDEFDLTEGCAEGIWLTVHADDNMKPGTYSCRLDIIVADKKTASAPIDIEVLPFKLQTPPAVVWGMYYEWDERFNSSVLSDMRRRGVNSVVLGQEKDLRKKIEEESPLELFEKLAMLKKLGFSGPFPWACTEPADGNILGRAFDKEKPALSREMAGLIKRMVERVLNESARRKLPPVLFYMADEPNGGFRNIMATQLYRAVKQVPGALTFVTITPEGLEPMKQWIDMRCYAKGYARDRLLGSEIRTEGAKFWYYTPPHQFDIGNSRRYSGFVMWGREITGHFRWHFYYPSSLGNPLNGLVRPTWFGQTALIYPGSRGEDVPTIAWEMYREGVDDYRYAYTLEQMVIDAVGTSQDQAAKTIARELTKLKKDAAASGPPANAWPGKRYNHERRRIIEWILQLQ